MNKKDIEKEISKFVDEIDTPYDLKEIEDKLDLKDNSYTLVKKEKKNPMIKHLMISLSAFSLGILVLVLVLLIPKGNNNENGNGVINSNSTTTINSETTTAISETTTAISDEPITIITVGDSTVSTNTKTHTTGAPTLMPTTTFSDPFESYFSEDINYIKRSEKLELNCEILFAQYYNEEESEYILVIFSKDYILDYSFDISNTITNEIYYSGKLDFVTTSNGFYSEVSTKEYNNNIKIQASYLSYDTYIVLEDA